MLLLSSSTIYGTEYLDYAEQEIRGAFQGVKRVLFVPYALADHEAYAQKACGRLQRMGFSCRSAHEFQNPVEVLQETDAIFVGGGNSFRLLKALYELNLIDAIRNRVKQGMIYMGASAGSNVACPTIRTTNDMPIVEPPSLNALNLFPIQINPHYIDPEPNSQHMGETREQRLMEFLEENETPVIGLREGAMLRMKDGKIELRGQKGARLFQRNQPAQELHPPAELHL